MKILALETSAKSVSVAVTEDGKVLGSAYQNIGLTHSRTLMPLLDGMLKNSELTLADMDLIAVAAGPGSFTGLRIGAAAVKGLAMALDKPVIEISTLEGLAYSCCESEKVVCPILDARRKQTYAAGYEFDTVAKEVIAQDALAIEDFIEKVNVYGKNALFLGDGVPVFKEDIEKLCVVPFSFAKPGQNRQSASSVLLAAKDKFDKGELKQGDELRLNYLRVSQAERERAEKGL